MSVYGVHSYRLYIGIVCAVHIAAWEYGVHSYGVYVSLKCESTWCPYW